MQWRSRHYHAETWGKPHRWLYPYNKEKSMRNKSMKATASLLVGGDEICGVLVCSARGKHQQLIIMHGQNDSITNTPLYINEQVTMRMGSHQQSQTSARQPCRHARTTKKITAILRKQWWVRLREWNIFMTWQETAEIFILKRFTFMQDR